MKYIKLIIQLLSLISMAAYAISKKVIFTVPLLTFSSMTLGILIGEKIGRNEENEDE